MRISVISVNGAPPACPAVFDFDSRGGAIGRENGNELVLPDPERHISRVQARVEFDGTQFVLVDMGGNPSSVNDRPVGKGNRVALTGGDRIAIGGYLLEVEFAHVAPVFSTPDLAASSSDPLGLFGGAPAATLDFSDPFAGLLGTPAASPAAAPSPASMPASDDPFAVFGAPVSPVSRPAASAPLHDPFATPPPPPAAPRADLLGLSGVRGEQSVDALFSLGNASHDPFAGTPLGDAPVAPSGVVSGEVDPLALLGGAAPAPVIPDPQRDDAPLLNHAFAPPRPEATAPEVAQVISPPSAAPRSPVVGMVFSWDDTPATPTPVPRSTPLDAAPSPAKVEISVDRVASDHPPTVIAPAPIRAPAPTRPTSAEPPAAAPASADALLDAFLRGLSVPLRLPAGLTPELMEQIGLVLHESTRGTLDLLTARALTKREVRAEVTMIVSKDNNPLKFAPDVGFALSQLLTPQSHGFMRPAEAIRDAYDDLRAHQFGFMAGMRAALTGVLKRFEPGALEERVMSRGVLDNILPGSRKARLWDLFEQMYGEISREAEDDFHALFGREFLRAYEEQVELLQAERGPSR
ncbi:type VI secretion system-associated FHA domain protein TagH [Zoogloea sp.]|uniref:type VI secretion system-associated FHA domain protein TagH n=1 Tax=Zoogloea sp. TaxID=49181 RepID=UPI0035B2D6FB